MFGRPPHETGVYDHSDPSRKAFNRFSAAQPSLIDDFWAAGYRSYGVGKIFHGPHEERWDDYYRQVWYAPIENRDAGVDSEKYDPDWLSPYDGRPLGNAEGMTGEIVDFGPSGKTADDDPDGVGTQWAIDRLRDHDGGPFFLGHGIYLPHEPWRLPQQFFDLHPIDEVELPPVRDDDLDDLGPYARENIIDRGGAFAALEASGKWREGVQAYQAAISYADWCVGQILDELRSSRYADDTIVAVWSDHGFHLGEKLHLRKFTLWERATHVPLVLNVPGQYDQGQQVDVPVALADIGPTLLDLCDAESATYAEGTSLVPIIDEPERADDRPPLTTWLEGNHAVRRGPYRYIRYRNGETELYDLDADPNEFDNLTDDPSYAAQKTELDTYLPAPVGS
jgi:arylsulfatase A-like enzyme